MHLSAILSVVVLCAHLSCVVATFYIELRTKAKESGEPQQAKDAAAQQKVIVTLYSCLNIEMQLLLQGKLLMSKCMAIPTAKERRKVLAFANFFPTIAPRKQDPVRILTLEEGTQLLEPLPNFVIGFNPQTPDSPFFEYHSLKKAEVKQLISNALSPFVPGENDLIDEVATLYCFNDVKVFGADVNIAKDSLLSYAAALDKIMDVKREQAQVARAGRRGWFKRKRLPTQEPKGPSEKQLKEVMTLLMYKMFDPCAVKSDPVAVASNYCYTYCQFLDLAANVFTRTMPRECSYLKTGHCEQSFCTCVQALPYWGRVSKSLVRMVYCNNVFRSKVNEALP